MNHEDVKVKKAAIERLRELNAIYSDSTEQEKDRISSLIMALVRKEIYTEFSAFRNIKAIDDTITGAFDVAFMLHEKELSDKIDFIRNGGVNTKIVDQCQKNG